LFTCKEIGYNAFVTETNGNVCGKCITTDWKYMICSRSPISVYIFDLCNTRYCVTFSSTNKACPNLNRYSFPVSLLFIGCLHWTVWSFLIIYALFCTIRTK
jgi:hypothetical protein